MDIADGDVAGLVAAHGGEGQEAQLLLARSQCEQAIAVSAGDGDASIVGRGCSCSSTRGRHRDGQLALQLLGLRGGQRKGQHFRFPILLCILFYFLFSKRKLRICILHRVFASLQFLYVEAHKSFWRFTLCTGVSIFFVFPSVTQIFFDLSVPLSLQL